MKSVTFNREVPTPDAVAKFYMTSIGSFEPWKYMDRNRLVQILTECYHECNPFTKKMISNFLNELDKN